MARARERALAVIEALAPHEPSVADVVDALEAVLEGDDEIRTALKAAEASGLIERDGARIRRPEGAPLSERREPTVIRREGEFRCRRCGQEIATGHFLVVGEAEIGPYGSTCVRRVSGR